MQNTCGFPQIAPIVTKKTKNVEEMVELNWTRRTKFGEEKERKNLVNITTEPTFDHRKFKVNFLLSWLFSLLEVCPDLDVFKV